MPAKMTPKRIETEAERLSRANLQPGLILIMGRIA
jgi:hypothetical protein